MINMPFIRRPNCALPTAKDVLCGLNGHMPSCCSVAVLRAAAAPAGTASAGAGAPVGRKADPDAYA
eukprot:CAMPEP_0179358348 /NCGR_PEP_ID=MMETSP0797-20121207/78882_1 /TAXON_ID=47934 /ORGANISM="Dinophysis acuminata, Strain DAEP01" /LENGTH=65 /DNA_ID=CAMNT_0021073603 /DNA_START=14 /DNA_END=210 /DNA_ORIENTATION=-